MLINLRHILFIVAHPDDAELAAGGTISMLRKHNVKVTVLVLTTSEFNEEARDKRRAAAKRASNILDYKLIFYEEGHFDQVEDIKIYLLTRFLDKLIEEIKPDAIFTHDEVDSHYDHFLTHTAVLASSRKTNAAIFCFPPNELRTIKRSQFCPNVYVDIKDYFEAKVEALKQFEYEGQNFMAISIEDIKKINNAFGIIANCELAEIFKLKYYYL